MSTSEAYFEDLYVHSLRPVTPSRSAFVFFHGFPGGGMRNQDLGEAIAKHTGANCYIVHFGGLGKGKGKFGFLHSVEQSLRLVDSLVQRDGIETLNIYGHSWGGLVALNVAERQSKKLGKLILVSPYSMLPPREMGRQILEAYVAEDSALAHVFSINEALDDVEIIKTKYNPRSVVKNIALRPGSTLFLQAKEDDEVPAPISRSFVPLFPVAPDYRELNQNHSFQDREALVKTVIDWLG